MNNTRDIYWICKKGAVKKSSDKEYEYKLNVDEYIGSAEDIAKYLGVSASWVYHCIKHQSLIKGYEICGRAQGRNVSSKYQVYEKGKLLCTGTAKQIADHYNVTTYTVFNACSRKGKMLYKYDIIQKKPFWKEIQDSVKKEAVNVRTMEEYIK